MLASEGIGPPSARQLASACGHAALNPAHRATVTGARPRAYSPARAKRLVETSSVGTSPSPQPRDGDGVVAPEDVRGREEPREEVRRGVLDALALELDRTSARTAGRLAAAAALGMAGAVGAVAVFSGHLLEGGHGWHLALCAAAWAALLVACFDVVLLRIRVQRIQLTHACVVALVGLGLAAVLGLLCPDRHHLAWWSSTRLGNLLVDRGGPGPGAFCLGACSALLVGASATAMLALRGVASRGAVLPGLLLFSMLWPAVLLQSADAPAPVFAWWSAGLFAGCTAGVALGRLARGGAPSGDDAGR
jgi:hypothetical protein